MVRVENSDPEGGNSDNAGFTAPAAAPGQAESRESKVRLDKLLEERLDGLLEARRVKPADEWETASPEPVAWEEMYYALLAERRDNGRARWDWRKALYIAWNCVPSSKRWPKHEIQLIELLGLTNTRTLRQWKEKDAEIEERIVAGPKRLLMGHVADVMEALVTVAKRTDEKAHQDRKLFLEMTGQYTPKAKAELTGEGGEPIEFRNVNELSDEELERIATGGSPRAVVASKRST